MNLVAPNGKASAPAPGFPVFWTILGRIVSALVGSNAHADVVITVRNGKVELVRVNQSFLPSQLPHV